jgi:hydroxyethylthiazole kinase
VQRVVDLLRHRPALIRGNASEILAVAGSAGAGGRGTDSTVGPEAALEAGKQLARQQECIVAISGASDLVLHDLRCQAVYGLGSKSDQQHRLCAAMSLLGIR